MDQSGEPRRKTVDLPPNTAWRVIGHRTLRNDATCGGPEPARDDVGHPLMERRLRHAVAWYNTESERRIRCAFGRDGTALAPSLRRFPKH